MEQDKIIEESEDELKNEDMFLGKHQRSSLKFETFSMSPQVKNIRKDANQRTPLSKTLKDKFKTQSD